MAAIRIHPRNPRIFEYAGKPRMLICATEHYGAVMNRPFRYERYLEDAAGKSQTLSRLFLLFRELQSDRNPYSTCKPESTDYVAPFARSGGGQALDGLARYDLAAWNPEFFDRLHGFLSAASRLGIVVEVTLLSNTYGPNIWALNPFNAPNNTAGLEEIKWWDYNTTRHPRLWAAQRAYLRKVVEEVNRYDNVILEVCNEPGGAVSEEGAPSCDDVNTWQKEIVALIRDVESRLPNKHLVAGQEAFAYDPVEGTRLTNDLSFRGMPFDVANNHPLPNTIYRGKRYDMGQFMSKQLALRAVRDFCLDTLPESRPLNLDEDNVASRFRDPEGWTIHRKRAWTALLSLRHYDVIDFSIAPWCEDGTPESRRAIRSWMGHLSDYVHSVDLARAHPAPEILRSLPPHTLGVALAVDGEDYSVYMADARELSDRGSGEPVDGDLVVDLPAGRYRVACYAPSSGLYSPWVETDGGPATCVRLPELRQDVVVRLVEASKVDRVFPRPGRT